MTGIRWCVWVWCLAACGVGWGQAGLDGTYSRVNTWSVFGEYSNDSSRILLGSAVNRKIGAVGFGYERRVVHGRHFDLRYAAEWRSGMLESDPTVIHTFIIVNSQGTIVDTLPPVPEDRCISAIGPYVPPPGITLPTGETVTLQTTCGRRQVIEQGLSPLGLRLNGRTRQRMQPTLSARMGILMATMPVPSINDANFNVFFDFGIGLEYYRSSGRSVRLEYVVQHYGSLGTVQGGTNPGVDNGFVKLTFALGRVK